MKRSEFYAMFITMIVLFTASMSWAVSYQPQIIQPTKAYSAYSIQSSAGNGTYYTLCDITGTGILGKAVVSAQAATSVYNEKLKLKITADGVESVIDITNAASAYSAGFLNLSAASSSSATSLVFQGPVYFKTSLKVEAMQDSGGAVAFDSTVNYALE